MTGFDNYKNNNYKQDDILMKIVNEIMDENPTQIEAYKSQPRLLDYFVGQMMKKTRGKANPALASKLLKDELERRK